MKKIISFILAAALAFTMVVLPASAVHEQEGIEALMRDLEIMQGDENGDMMLDKYVSRAEFAKIAIASSPQKNSVALGLKQSPFKDVPYYTWYAPYVKASVSANYVVGYLDSTFRPENTVTYEEAVTIMLRVLGYKDTDFSDAYPYGQLSKAQSLDLLKDVDCAQGEEMTRYNVMRLVYNALGANTSNGEFLCQSHDTNMIKNGEVIATSNEDDSLGADKVFTSSGTYNKGDYFDDGWTGVTGTLYVKNDKDLISVVADKNSDNEGYKSYFVYSVLPNSSVIGYKNGNFEEIDIPDGAKVYKDQNATTYGAAKGSLEMGDTLNIKYTQNGSVDYVTYDTSNIEGPVIVRDGNWLMSLGADATSKVFRSGVESTVSAISANDVVYYSKPLNVLFAYTDKVTGVYEKATPTKDAPKTVTISGKEYNVESVDAFKDLSSSGAYKYGDTVTALLGRDGAVAGIAQKGGSGIISTSTGTSMAAGAGFVIETGKKDFTNADNTVYSSYYAKLALPDGSIAEYPTVSNYNYLKCGVVRITFKNGKASLSRSTSSLRGKVNASKNMIGGEYVADNVEILDTVGTDTDDTPLYKRIYLQRLSGINITSNNVAYSSTNDDGEIDKIILTDATGDLYSYGFISKIVPNAMLVPADIPGHEGEPVKGVRTRREGTNINVMIDGRDKEYTTSIIAISKGWSRLVISDSAITKITTIGPYSGNISELTQTTATINNNTYKLSDDVIVYFKPDATSYLKIPIEEAIDSNYRMTAYYDKPESSGGRIRIIVAEKR